MKRTLAILITFLGITTPLVSLGDEVEKDLSQSSWRTSANTELYSQAYTWEYLLVAHKTAWDLYMRLWSGEEQSRPNRDIAPARQSAKIKSNLAEVVLEAFDRTTPLLRKHPDKVITQVLLLHAIRYSGGSNERWEGVVESLCSVNEDWTFEALKELENAEREKFKAIITGVGETEQSESNLEFLRLLEKAAEESAEVPLVMEPRRASPNGFEDDTHLVLPNGKIKNLQNAALKQDGGDQPAPDPAQKSSVKLWRDGRITPEQPFKAQVIGVIPGWIGDTIILKETSEKERYCIANLTMDRFFYQVLETSEFDRKEMLERGATFLSPPVDVGRFSWSMGIWRLGSIFGDEDSVTKWYQKLGIQKLGASEDRSD